MRRNITNKISLPRRAPGNGGNTLRRVFHFNKSVTINNASSMYDYGLSHIDFNMNDCFGGKVLIAGFDQFKVVNVVVKAKLGVNTIPQDCDRVSVYAAPDFDGQFEHFGRGTVFSSALTNVYSFRPNSAPVIANFSPKTNIDNKWISDQFINTGAWGEPWKGLNVCAVDYGAPGIVSTQKTIILQFKITVLLKRPIPNNVYSNALDNPIIGVPSTDNPTLPDPIQNPTQLIGFTFDVVTLGRVYTVVGGDDSQMTVLVSYSEVTANESLGLSDFATKISASEWFGNAITNWTGPDISHLAV